MSDYERAYRRLLAGVSDATAARARDAFLAAEAAYQGGGELVAWRAAVESGLQEIEWEATEGDAVAVPERVVRLQPIRSLYTPWNRLRCQLRGRHLMAPAHSAGRVCSCCGYREIP